LPHNDKESNMFKSTEIKPQDLCQKATEVKRTYDNLGRITRISARIIGANPNQGSFLPGIVEINNSTKINQVPIDLPPIDLPTKTNLNIPTLKSSYTVMAIKGTPFFSSNIGVTGANRVTNCLYLSMDPYLIANAETADILSTLQNGKVAAMALGRRHVYNLLSRIKNLHPDKTPTVIILGTKNLTAYQNAEGTLEIIDRWRSVPQNNKDKDFFPDGKTLSISKGYLNESGKEELKHITKTDTDVNFYTIKARGQTIPFSSQDVQLLYDIYQETVGSDNPVLIHCSNSTRAFKLALTFELLRNFDHCFLSDDITEKAAIRVATVYNQLRSAHSPVGLSNVVELAQTIGLACMLKMIECERVCINEIRHLYEDNKDFPSISQPIKDILVYCEDRKEDYYPYDTRITHIAMTITSTPALQPPPPQQITFFEQISLRSTYNRGPYEWLKTLGNNIYMHLNGMEPKILEICADPSAFIADQTSPRIVTQTQQRSPRIVTQTQQTSPRIVTQTQQTSPRNEIKMQY
jgi:hypothetical protein